MRRLASTIEETLSDSNRSRGDKTSYIRFGNYIYTFALRVDVNLLYSVPSLYCILYILVLIYVGMVVAIMKMMSI